MRKRVLPYHLASKSGRAVARSLGALRLRRPEESRFVGRSGDVIINWGYSGSVPDSWKRATWFNTPEAVAQVSNKLTFFSLFGELDELPPHWTRKEDIPEDAYPIVCRTILNGHSGRGIVIAETPEELVEAPLYVAYIKKMKEFRVHITRQNGIISLQEKRRRNGVENIDARIRNLSNGYVFCRQNVEAPECVKSAAHEVFACTQLDFGALDIVYNEYYNRAFVLEINTAPATEGTTLDDYQNYFANN